MAQRPNAAADSDSGFLRRLGLGAAVAIGLASMLPGLFAALGPAAAAASDWLLLALLGAAAVAYMNATSTADLAALYPRSGATYVYAGERLGPAWGYLAGWAFLSGKVVSAAALALALGGQVVPEHERLVALGVVALLTAMNCAGVRVTAVLSAVAAAILVVALLLVAIVGLLDGSAPAPRPGSAGPSRDWSGLLEGAGLLFFAFTGYSRIATLGGEVRDPARTIGRAVPITVGIVLSLYGAVVAAGLVVLGAGGMAAVADPIHELAAATAGPPLTRFVATAGTVGIAGVVLSLLVGMSRTSFAMAVQGDLPRWLRTLHPRFGTPVRADVLLGVGVGSIVLVLDLHEAVGFGAFLTLVYYLLANISAATLPASQRHGLWVAVAGAAGCVTLAASLPSAAVWSGAAVLSIGLVPYAVRHLMGRFPPPGHSVLP